MVKQLFIHIRKQVLNENSKFEDSNNNNIFLILVKHSKSSFYLTRFYEVSDNNNATTITTFIIITTTIKSLENFRSYKSQQSVSSLSFISSFIGPNNSGKSNIIKALLWYQEIGRLRINSGSPRQFEIKRLFNTGCRNFPLKIDVEFELDESERAYLLNLLPYKNQDIGKSIQKTQLLKRIKHSLSFSYANILLSETVLITIFLAHGLIFICIKTMNNIQMT